MKRCRAIVIGSSAGGLNALAVILSALPPGFSIPIALVQHQSPESPGILAELLSARAKVTVKEAEDKEKLRPGTVYVAPPNYHLLVEKGGTISLSVDEKENHSRPSIDVLFESAAEAFGEDLIGVILTGANSDGSSGLKRVQEAGGVTVVQDPDSAESPEMPRLAIKSVKVDHVLSLEKIAAFLGSCT